jgi:hypothetical protein
MTGKKRPNTSLGETPAKKAKLVVDGSKSEGRPAQNQKTPFRRVVSQNIDIEKAELRDNSYKSFDTWGAKANQVCYH